uniref:KRAB domain-containing protein n=1 Tax=Piliocolobus tephrosceles TaxID=591936 RepID=A0A8C9GY52_9PRIM
MESHSDLVAFEVVAVNFGEEDWYLINLSQKNLYRYVMQETFGNMVSIRNEWEDQNVEGHFNNLGRNLKQKVGTPPYWSVVASGTEKH